MAYISSDGIVIYSVWRTSYKLEFRERKFSLEVDVGNRDSLSWHRVGFVLERRNDRGVVLRPPAKLYQSTIEPLQRLVISNNLSFVPGYWQNQNDWYITKIHVDDKFIPITPIRIPEVDDRVVKLQPDRPGMRRGFWSRMFGR